MLLTKADTSVSKTLKIRANVKAIINKQIKRSDQTKLTTTESHLSGDGSDEDHIWIQDADDHVLWNRRVCVVQPVLHAPRLVVEIVYIHKPVKIWCSEYSG